MKQNIIGTERIYRRYVNVKRLLTYKITSLVAHRELTVLALSPVIQIISF